MRSRHAARTYSRLPPSISSPSSRRALSTSRVRQRPGQMSEKAREAHRCAVEGVRLIQLGCAGQAIPLLQQSVRLNPGVTGAHHDLGVALMAAGRPKQASESFDAAVRLDRRNVSALHNLAARSKPWART
jgi:Flp pilus assembly protein TadD